MMERILSLMMKRKNLPVRAAEGSDFLQRMGLSRGDSTPDTICPCLEPTGG